jgi:hypothetical protein
MNLDDILSLATLRLALRRWYVLVLVLVVALASALVTCIVVPKKYHVTAFVIGTRYQNDITPSNQTASFSASALLGGTTNDLPAITDFRLYMQLLTSPELGSSIINEPILHRVFPKAWHEDHWGPPDTVMQRVLSIVLPLVGRQAWSPPDGFMVAHYLENHVSVVAGKDAKMMMIGTWNSDRDLGRELLTLLNNRADGLVRAMAQKRFQAKVEFLESALAAANVQETRTALGSALAKAKTDEIFSFSNLPFAAEFVAPPDSSQEPEIPNILYVTTGFLAGGALSFFGYIVVLQKRQLAIAKTKVGRPELEIGARVQTN